MNIIIDRKNLLVIIIALLLLIVIGVVIPYIQVRNREKKSPQNTTNIPSQTQNVNITYTNKGFEPNSMRIPSGTTVVWTNVSDKLMWIGSDPHPSHTDLPGFDQRGTDSNVPHDDTFKLIPHVEAHSTDSVYAYTFIKVGIWDYHNHLSPGDRGEIIVY